MERIKSRQESGQIIIILALALVGLLGFTALAIDVGMVFSQRRNDQGVADSAALAGARQASQVLVETNTQWVDFDCNLPPGSWVTNTSTAQWGTTPVPGWVTARLDAILQAAIDRAGINGTTIEKGFEHQNGVAFHCQEIPNGPKYIEIKVEVSSVTRASFAHFVFGSLLHNTVEAITRIEPDSPASYGDSILALLDGCGGNDGGLHFDGNVKVVSYDGRMFSNWCMTNTSNSTNVQVLDSEHEPPTFPDACIPGGIGFIDPDSTPGNEDSCPATNYAPEYRIEYFPVADINCPADFSPNVKINSGGDAEVHHIYPGKYRDITVSKGILYVHPGLYCIESNQANQGLTFTGGNIVSVDYGGVPVDTTDGCKLNTSGGCGNTFWLISGNFNVSGNGESILAAPANDRPNNLANCKDKHCAIPGLLIGAAMEYTGLVDMEGTAGDTFTGTIYVPHGEVDIGGNTTTNPDVTDPNVGPLFTTQIIADRIRFHGTAGVTVRFDEEVIWVRPAMLYLMK